MRAVQLMLVAILFTCGGAVSSAYAGGHHNGHRSGGWQSGSIQFGIYVGPTYSRPSIRPHRARNMRRGRCTAHHALRKARRIGVHRARIVKANRRIVKVIGRKRGHRRSIVFANARHCPRLR